MLKIKSEFRKGILFVRMKGELNKDTISYFNREAKLIKDMKICNVVFNLSSLNSIDIYGANSILKTYKSLKRLDGISMICGLNEKIKKVVNHNLFEIFQIKDEKEALNIIKI